MLAEDESRASSTEGAENTDFGGAGKLEYADYRPEDCHYDSRRAGKHTQLSNAQFGAEDVPLVSIVTSAVNIICFPCLCCMEPIELSLLPTTLFLG